MRLQVQVLDLALLRRLRTMLFKSQRKKTKRKELDRLIQDGITERRRYDQARRGRTEITYLRDAGIQVATARYLHPNVVFIRSEAT
jgi:hypothetical protein